MTYAMRSMSGLGGAADRYATPGLASLEDDWKLIQAQLVSAMSAVRVEDAQYTGVLGRLQQFARTGGAGSSAVTIALSTGEAQQVVARLLSTTGLAVLQAARMDRAYAAGDPRAISLGTRLVSNGRDAVRIAEAIAIAASAVTHGGTSGLGLTTSGLTVIAGLLMAPISFGFSVPVSLLLAAAQAVTGLNVDIGEALRFFGLPTMSDMGEAFQKFVQPTINNFTKPFGWVFAVLAGAAAVGVVGYIAWNVYVARKAVRRVTGNRRRRVSAKQLRMGIRVEQEHTRHRPSRKLSRAIAREIAEDHLREMPDYYTRLAKMERGVRRNGAEVAQTILQQLGNQTLAMIGAKNLLDSGNGLQFSVGGNPKRITKILITLEPSDTYTMQFWKGHGVHMKLAAEETGVYFDMLRSMIERHTMLRTRL